MGFFSSYNSSPSDLLKSYARKASLKLLGITIGWIAVYFLTQLFTSGVLALLNLLVGSLAGVVIGWTLADDAAEDTSLTGLPLWTLLTILGVLPIIVVELLFYLLTHWPLDFGRWMCLSSAAIMTMVSAVWRSSADE
jgi:hypothetical protein